MQGINKMLPPVPTQWGAPLTGAQMKLLMAAGLKGSDEVQTVTWGGVWHGCQIGGGINLPDDAEFRLPADHPAYALLEAGWLDGRNVALWFGGEKAPDDLSEGADVLFRGGVAPPPLRSWTWRHLGIDGDIIAYTRKAEGLTTHADRVLADAERMAKRMGGKFVKNEHWGDVVAASGEAAKADACAGCHGLNTSCPDGCFDEQPIETVTIAKMTDAEVSEVALSHRMTTAEVWGAVKFCRLIGLIKPEPTREERFWQAQPLGGADVDDRVKAWVREGLNFERD